MNRSRRGGVLRLTCDNCHRELPDRDGCRQCDAPAVKLSQRRGTRKHDKMREEADADDGFATLWELEGAGTQAFGMVLFVLVFGFLYCWFNPS